MASADPDGPWDAVFVNAASSLTTRLFVKIPAYDGGEHQFGPVVWDSHAESSGDAEQTFYPEKGDQCLVVRGPNGRWWVIDWIDADHDDLGA
jgi:hypothetical protein